MQTKYLSEQQLKSKTDVEIAELWNILAKIFKNKNNVETNQTCTVGFLQLSRETKRRGFELHETKFGKIILQPLKETA